ncbi:MAG: peptidylprolyl isomerase, partial [bacterium]
MQKYYEERKVQYGRPQVKARHILVKEEALATELYTKLQGGDNFDELAKQHSQDKSNAANGGDLGWFNENTMVKEFNDAAFAAEKGALLAPVQTRFGFHIIKVEDKRDATPLEEVRPQIEAALRQEAIDAIRKEAKEAMK